MSVFGTISTNIPGPVTSYPVDDQLPTVFNPPVPVGAQHRQRFFHSGYLDPGQHVLVLTNIEDGDEVWVDYFEVEPAPQTISSMYSVVLTCHLFRSLPTGTSQSLPPASSSSTTETDSSLSHSQSPPTSTVPPTETSSSSTALADSSFPHLQSSLSSTIPPSTGTNTLPSRKNTPSSTLPTGVIVGFVVGGALVVVLVIAAIVLLRTSKKKGKVSKGTYSSFYRTTFGQMTAYLPL